MYTKLYFEKKPLEWKGKGKKTSMEIDNSQDSEIPIDISCSEEGQTPPSRKRTSKSIHQTTLALRPTAKNSSRQGHASGNEGASSGSGHREEGHKITKYAQDSGKTFPN